MALFKIMRRSNNSTADLEANSGNNKVATKDGYAYFDQQTGKFYIDIANSYAPIVGINSTSTDGVNRICINPTYTILNCGNSNC